jgi:hypothetical protein
MTPDQHTKLRHIVDRYVTLNDQIKSAKDEQKELADAAKGELGIEPKVTKQLAKETAWNELERAAQLGLERQLDECRLALGLLDGTPLGEAAVGAAALGGGWHHSADGTRSDDGHGVAEPKRGRGRPKGSRNRPKVRDEFETAAPPSIPDWPQ